MYLNPFIFVVWEFRKINYCGHQPPTFFCFFQNILLWSFRERYKQHIWITAQFRMNNVQEFVNVSTALEIQYASRKSQLYVSNAVPNMPKLNSIVRDLVG